MKKLIGLFICIVVITGCGNKINKYEKIMEEYSSKYYLEHMNKNAEIFEITISLLKKASVTDGYDMSKLKKCEDSSLTKIYIDQTTKEILKYEHNLKCK
ncbi:MAG TPA: hypothetical protein GX747_01225 [Tenericutes bacterium]|nr:hypothetical protein [Mycoplasmatota bacterium]